MQSWDRLLGDPARLRYGFLAVLAVGMGYAVTVAGIAISHGTPSTPWLPIPPAEYFKWEALFVAPVTLLCWIVAACVVQVLSKPLHGRGTLRDTLAVLGLAIAGATLISLIPDAIRAALTTLGYVDRAAWEHAVEQPGTPDFVFLWAYMLAYLAALLWLFHVAVATAQRLHGWRALVVGLAGAVVYQGLYVTIIR
jgi:hypothetical protein